MLFTVLALVAAFLVTQRAWAWYRLRHVKGPFWAAFGDLWMLRRILAGTLYEDLDDVCNEYGKRQLQSRQHRQ